MIAVTRGYGFAAKYLPVAGYLAPPFAAPQVVTRGYVFGARFLPTAGYLIMSGQAVPPPVELDVIDFALTQRDATDFARTQTDAVDFAVTQTDRVNYWR